MWVGTVAEKNRMEPANPWSADRSDRTTIKTIQKTANDWLCTGADQYM